MELCDQFVIITKICNIKIICKLILVGFILANYGLSFLSFAWNVSWRIGWLAIRSTDIAATICTCSTVANIISIVLGAGLNVALVDVASFAYA